MKPKQVFRNILLPGVVLLFILWACNTPSIPMPPPGSEVVSFVQEDDEHYRLTVEDDNGYIQPYAEVTVKNRTLNVWVGGLANDTGGFTSAPFPGTPGVDMIQLTFVKNGEGGTTCFILEVGTEPTEDPRCGN